MDGHAALPGREHDVVGPQLADEVVDRDAKLLLAKLPVAAAEVAGLHARQLKRHHPFAEQRDDPANGPDETGAAPAGPIHRLGEVELEDQAGQLGGQDVDGCAARGFLLVGEVLALGCLGDLQGGGLDAEFPGETRRGALAGGLWRAGNQLHLIGLARREVHGFEHQTARRGFKHLHLAGKLVVLQQRFEQLAQLLQGGLDHPVGDLFGADFKQERQRLHAAASRLDCATQVWATPTASLRTRAMTPTRSVTLIAPRESSRLNRCEHFSTWS